MKVKLISFTLNPESLVAAAAKLCYSSAAISEIYGKSSKENSQKFISMLLNLGHESPLEHISFTFGIEEVSRAFLAQLTRHRIASYSVQSQRYVKNTDFEYVIPEEIEAIPEAKEIFLKVMHESQIYYENLTELLKNKHKKIFLSDGYSEKNAESMSEKKAIEDARFVLPNACATKILCTFNARSLLNFFRHRCCNRAQWEIRNVACKMFELVFKICPSVFQNAGPSCLSGACQEAKMTCGKADLVRKKFNSLKS